MVQQRFLSVKETATYLGLSASAVRKWIRCGRIPFRRLNRSIRFDLDEINRWTQKANS